MKKVTEIITCALIGLLISACGPSSGVENETICISACLRALNKSANKCDISYDEYSDEESECSNLALSTGDECLARCYGNL